MPESVIDHMPAEEDPEVALMTASGQVFTPLDPRWPERRADLRRQLDAARAECQDIEASLSAKCQEIEASLSAECREIEASLSAECREVKASLSAECQELEASLSAAHEHLGTTREQLRGAIRRERDAKDQSTWLHVTALEPLRNRVAELESRLERSETARQRAEADLRQALASTSWRLTAPLRFVADLLRGRRSPSISGSARLDLEP